LAEGLRDRERLGRAAFAPHVGPAAACGALTCRLTDARTKPTSPNGTVQPYHTASSAPAQPYGAHTRRRNPARASAHRWQHCDKIQETPPPFRAAGSLELIRPLARIIRVDRTTPATGPCTSTGGCHAGKARAISGETRCP
jgi:hypothetical protein